MYGIFTYIWVIFRANVGKYSIHGAYGLILTIINSILTTMIVYWDVFMPADFAEASSPDSGESTQRRGAAIWLWPPRNAVSHVAVESKIPLKCHGNAENMPRKYAK